jgi:hypothetical protein
MEEMNLFEQFRQAVYGCLQKRADTLLDLIDSLTVAGHVESPVALSEEIPFRRQHSSIPDALNQGEMDLAKLGQVLYDLQPAQAETIAGYEVYAVDTTPEERPEAETLADRGQLKSQKDAPVRLGHKYSWLARLVTWRTSWIAPLDVQRVATASSDSAVAAEQVKSLDQRSVRPKVVVADSLYANKFFLAVFLVVKTVVALVRLRHNRVLYEQPAPKLAGQPGAPRKHGAKFKLSSPRRPPDRTEDWSLAGQLIRLQAWHNLHLRQLPDLVGLALRVEFLKADGTPRFKLPLWLFWTGPLDVPLSALCQMYLWRFAIEHAFRFLKGHLGLTANFSTNLSNTTHWIWLCALAYWQLLQLRPLVAENRPAWYRRRRLGQPLTPGLVQRAALKILLGLDGPAKSPRPAGKGRGRQVGFRPQPRPRFAVVKKGQKRPKMATKALATA